jgi:spoIIIJ-associated protein
MEPKDTEAFIREFLTRLCIAVTAFERVTVGGHDVFNIETPDSKLLIGPQGDTLRACNMLLRRLLERNVGEGHEKCMLDVNGYQLERIRDIEQKAKILADRVRTFRSSAEMVPMNAYERMIVHSMFSEDPDICTESSGFGPTRHVILKTRT